MIEGARRIGKSYIVEEFARNEYRSYMLIDFSKVSKEVKEIFDNYLTDEKMLFRMLSLQLGVKLYPRESLIIFDEVQKYPRAREAVKELVANHTYDYIETGSLVSIHKNTKNILIPSEERRIDMYPMDLEEFMWALGESDMMVENLVAQMLSTTGKRLYYYSNSDKEDSSERMEIDFLIRKPSVTSKHNICPVEVKSTQRYTTSSLDKFRNKFNSYLHTSYVIHSGDLKREEGIVYLPLYMASLL